MQKIQFRGEDGLDFFKKLNPVVNMSLICSRVLGGASRLTAKGPAHSKTARAPPVIGA
jgi:hypothetical protein